MDANKEPFVSILTPVYNGEDYLAECIESVLHQTYQNYEYIIVNNCSKDRTLAIAQEYAKRDARIRVHDNTEFLPVIANHNHAFGMVSPEARYCKVVSGDDYLFPSCVSRMVALAEANPSVGIVGSYQQSGDVVKWQGFMYPASVIPGVEVGRRFFLEREVFVRGRPIFGFGSPTSILYRADLVRENKDFYPNASPHADSSACFKYLRNSDFGFVYEVLSYERTHAQTQSSKSALMNRYSSASLNDLIQYGAFYLSPQELRERIDETLRQYHRFLTVNYLLGYDEKEFWKYHRERLAELGFPLTKMQLWKAALSTIGSEIVNPAQAIRKFRSRTGKSKNVGPVEAVPNTYAVGNLSGGR